MIIYVPDWLEFAYLNLFKNKIILYNNYEYLLEEAELIFIKNLKEIEYEKYINSQNIIVISKSNNQDYTHITCEFILKELCIIHNYIYDKKILEYCENNQACPFITILNLSLGGTLPIIIKNNNEEFMKNNIISNSKFLQNSLWYCFIYRKNNTLWGRFQIDKCLYLYEYLIETENTFMYINTEISYIYYLILNLCK